MSPHQSSYRLCIAADSDSTFLARITDVLACLDLVPERLDARQETAGTGFVILATVLVSATTRQIDLLTRKIRQVTLVHAVECECRAGGRDR